MNKNLIAFKRFGCSLLEDLDLATIEAAQAHARMLIETRATAGKKSGDKRIKLDDAKAVANRENVRRWRAKNA